MRLHDPPPVHHTDWTAQESLAPFLLIRAIALNLWKIIIHRERQQAYCELRETIQQIKVKE